MIKLAFGRHNVLVSKFKAGAAISILWLAILCGASFLVYLGLDSYDKAKTRLSDQATTYAHLIAAHHRFGFTVADVILRDMLDYLTWSDFNGTMTPERRHQVLGYLTRHRERLPGIASFTVIGADGIRRIGVVGKDFTNLSDRGYFQACRDGREFFISNVEDGRASGKPGIHVARRYTAPDGSFGGVILINLAAEEVFVPFYRSLDLGKNYGTTLRDPERILISYPKYTLSAQPLKERDRPGDQMAAGHDRGTLLTTDPADGLQKLTAFERLEGSNIFATASLPVASAMGEARVLITGAFLSALACILGAAGATSAVMKAHALAKARDEAVKAGAERKRLITKLNTAVEDERKAVAIEIHDVLNGILVGVKMDSQAILAITSQPPTPFTMDEIAMKARSITKQANDLYMSGRALVTRLRPELLDVLGLDRAVEEIVTKLDATSAGCRFTFHAKGDMANLDSNIAIAAYRVVQEALSNVVKHARASHASVALEATHDAVLRIVIADDGVGLEGETSVVGIGVIGMRERMAALNGRLEIRSGPKGGTTITAEAPLSQRQGTTAPEPVAEG
jgi:signal transduction histidine kinase